MTIWRRKSSLRGKISWHGGWNLSIFSLLRSYGFVVNPYFCFVQMAFVLLTMLSTNHYPSYPRFLLIHVQHRSSQAKGPSCQSDKTIKPMWLFEEGLLFRTSWDYYHYSYAMSNWRNLPNQHENYPHAYRRCVENERKFVNCSQSFIIISLVSFEYCMYGIGIKLRGNGNKCQISHTKLSTQLQARLTFEVTLLSAARFRLLRAAPLSILALPLARRAAVRRWGQHLEERVQPALRRPLPRL